MGKRSGGMQTRPAGASPAPEPARAEAEGGAVAEEERVGAGPAVGSFSRVALPDAIRVVDEERREIEVCATSEAVDSYGTIFDYAASKTAFERWIGNVREMHERKAVGSKVAVRYDDEARRVYTRVRISRGAEDTWQKILDGTLRGASIGAANVVWHEQVRSAGAPPVPVATSYELAELSLVDNPSNPDALGLSVMRDGVPDPAGSLLDALDVDAGAASAGLGTAAVIDERDGSLSVLDVAAEIARAAQARGQAQIAAASSATEAAPVPSGDAPSRLDRKLGGIAAVGGAEVVRTPAAVSPPIAAGEYVGASLDVDGDHETAADYVDIQSGPTAGAVAAPSPAGSVAHMAHAHHHTGRYDDPSNHRETSGHMHLDGTSHEHEHLMDHRHGDHEHYPDGHSHPHVHVPDHEHYYRVADGAPVDSRLVSAEDVRTFAVVSGPSFAAAAGVEGRALSAEQMRAAMAAELRLIYEARAGGGVGRAMGPYSRDPQGPSDAGTPANAAPGVVPTEQLVASGSVSTGQASTLDRDGQPLAAGTGAEAPMAPGDADVATPAGDGGVHDASNPPADGWTGRVSEADVVRAVAESVSRAIEGLRGQFSAQLTTELGKLDGRLARIEAQPMPASGGPVLRAGAIDKGTLLAGGSGGAGGSGSQSQAARIAALEGLAGRLTDPQAQVAVAAEMIRLQQEGSGMAPAFQVMPRAGNGPVRG